MVDFAPNFDTTEEDMAENLYQGMRVTNFAADVFKKYPEVNIEEFSKVLAQGGMDGYIGDFTKKLTNNHEEFLGIVQRAMEKAFSRCLKEYAERLTP